MISKPLFLALASSMTIGLAACQSDPQVPIDPNAYVGKIVNRTASAPDTASLALLIRAVSDECGAVYSVNEETILRRRTSSNAVLPAAPGDFEVGMSVRVWSDGLYAESCPGQAHATRVELLP
jgi:hypothetical protein